MPADNLTLRTAGGRAGPAADSARSAPSFLEERPSVAPSHHRRTAPRASKPGAAAQATAPRTELLKLAAVWGLLGAYGAMFFIFDALTTSSWGGSFDRWQFFQVLLLPDELWQSWTRDASWHAIVQRVTIAALAAAVFAVAWAAGWLALHAIRIDERLSRLERFVFAAGMGLNLVSLATLAAGLAGLLRVELFAAVGLAVVAAAAFVRWRGSGQSAGGDRLAIAPEEDDGLVVGRRWLWLAVPLVVAIGLGAMLPPIDFDVREYHLQAPRSSTRPDGSVSCPTTSTRTCRSVRKCSAWRAWSRCATGGLARWPANC